MADNTYNSWLDWIKKSSVAQAPEKIGSYLGQRLDEVANLPSTIASDIAKAPVPQFARTLYNTGSFKQAGQSFAKALPTIQQIPNLVAGALTESGIETPEDGNFINKIPKESMQVLRGTKGMTAADIMSQHPDIQLTKDVPAKDIYGNSVKIPQGEALTPYELKGNKILLQDGETYIVSKNQYANIKGNALSGEAKPFAPELKGTEETVKGTNGKWDGNNFYDANGNQVATLVGNTDGTWSFESDFSEGSDTFATRGEAKRQAMESTIGDIYGENATKYSAYQLPSGENYKEILIKAPESSEIKKIESSTVGENIKQAYLDKLQFKSSHWDEPNVISHLRLNERTYQGKPVTFMEELQSDWAREGRSKGFIQEMTPEEKAQVKKNYEYTGGGTPPTTKGSVPNNPLLKNWQEPTIKRALQEAVANGSEYFSWINGEQTSARYNLATQVENVKWDKTSGIDPEKVRRIEITPKDKGGQIVATIDKNGVIKDGTVPQGWKGKKLDEVLGKGLADKIMADEKGTLSGEGLKFGGEWAHNLYDKQVKDIVQNVTGAKAQPMDLGLPLEKDKPQFYDRSPIKKNQQASIVKPEDLKVGKEITKASSYGDTERYDYIITDVLGDGKFKAVEKEYIGQKNGFVIDKNGQAVENTIKNIPDRVKETFDISTKTTTQQGIKLTPEIKARIRGEASTIKSSGKKFAEPPSRVL